MYKLEYYQDGKLRSVLFVKGEELEMSQYKQKLESQGYTVGIWEGITNKYPS